MVLAGSGILLTTIGGGILGAVARGRNPRRESNLPPSRRVSHGARSTKPERTLQISAFDKHSEDMFYLRLW